MDILSAGRRRLYSLLKMRDVLNIKIDAEIILVGFKGWFRCQILFQRGRKPWCTFRGRNYIRDRDIDVGHVQKVLFSDLCHEISCPDFFWQFLIRFRSGFFLIERPMGRIVGRRNSAIFDIWGRSYSTPKFEKSDFSEITFFKSIFSRTIFNML